jgi:hypothetical protein
MSEVDEEQAGLRTPAPGSFAEWARGWRYFFWFLAVVLLMMLFYAEENWRGPWAWARAQRAMQARGERTEARDLIPPDVAVDENFAMTPLLVSAFQARSLAGFRGLSVGLTLAGEYESGWQGTSSLPAAHGNTWAGPPPGLAIWSKVLLKAANQTIVPRHRLEATNFAVAEAAEAVLSVLTSCEPAVAELREASRRPYSRFDLAYDQPDPASILLPHLAVLKQLSRLVRLRADAELAVGRGDAAFEDVELMLRLADATRSEPIHISQLVRTEQLLIALPSIAQGVGRWSDSQLRRLQDQLERVDLFSDGARVLRAERSFFGNGLIECVRTSEDRPSLLSMYGGFGAGNQPARLGWAGLLMAVAPEGWFDLERVNHSRLFQDYLLPMIDDTNRLVSPDASVRAEAHMAGLLNHSAASLFLRHRLFCALLVPGLSRSAQRIAFAQTGTDLAALGCALERYRRQQGQFPDTLAALVPGFVARLPHDAIDGQPLKYRRTEEGGYVLYSVGWNQADDGGKVVLGKGGELDRLLGDWVWNPGCR